jgi:hypothetical protein
VKRLCTRAVSQYSFSMAAACSQPDDRNPWPYDKVDYDGDEFDYGLMCAAAYFNKLSVVEKIASNPAYLHVSARTYGDPCKMAIEGDHHAAFDLLLSKDRALTVNIVREAINLEWRVANTPWIWPG